MNNTSKRKAKSLWLLINLRGALVLCGQRTAASRASVFLSGKGRVSAIHSCENFRGLLEVSVCPSNSNCRSDEPFRKAYLLAASGQDFPCTVSTDAKR